MGSKGKTMIRVLDRSRASRYDTATFSNLGGTQMKHCAVALMIVLLALGCAREKKPEEPQKPSVDAVFEQARSLYQTGDTNGVVDLLAATLEDPDYEASYPRVFDSLIGLLVSGQQQEVARARMLAMLAENPSLAAAAVGHVTRGYEQAGDTEGVIAWTDQLLQSALPDETALRVLAWNVDARLSTGQLDVVVAAMSDTIARFGNGSQRVYDGAKTRLLKAGDLEGVEALLVGLENVEGGGPWIRDFTTVSRMQVLIRNRRWDEAEQLFRTTVGELGEKASIQAFRSLGLAVLKAGDTALSDRLCRGVLDNADNSVRLRETAAAHWITTAQTAAQLNGIPGRFDTLLDEGISAVALVGPYHSNFYAVLQQGEEAAKVQMLEIGARLAAEEMDDRRRNALVTLQFDGAFLMERFDRVLALLQEGVPERDEAWHAMAINKVSAHKALKEGDIEEAVTRFRGFMAEMDRTWQGAETDPSTGLRHTREMVLGFNARRIADILRDAGQAEKAQESYAEAIAYYEQALAQAKVGSKEHEHIVSMLTELPVAGAEAPDPPAPGTQEPGTPEP